MSQLVVVDVEKIPDIFRQSFELVLSEITAKRLDVMTKSELADYLRCDVQKINRYMKKGLPFVMFGETPRFYRDDIDNWLKQGL